MKVKIYLLNINNYEPEITSLCYPLIKHYADKIHASVHVITERKFPEFPVVYEKLQIYKMAKEDPADWHMYIDSDTLIHPECPSFLEFISKDTVMHNGSDFANLRWTYDRFFRRDGRNIGSCNWFACASDWCIDLWEPIQDLTLAEILSNIHPTANETTCGITAEHLIDDYTLSRNIAKNGFKFTTVMDLLPKLGFPKPAGFFFHQYTITTKQKVEDITRCIREWKLPKELTQPAKRASVAGK